MNGFRDPGLSIPRMSMSLNRDSSRARSQDTNMSPSPTPEPPGSPSSNSEASSGEQELEDEEPITLPALASPTTLRPTAPWPFGSVSSRQDANALVHAQVAATSPPRTTSASALPHEILLAILKLLPSNNDLKSSIRVCKSWCQCGVELLWHRPAFYRPASLHYIVKVIASDNSTFPYAQFIRRLNFSMWSEYLDDSLMHQLSSCNRLERLTLSGSSNITNTGITELIRHCHNLVALDLSDCEQITNTACIAIAENCPRLQGLNLSGCRLVGDYGLVAIGRSCKNARRVKLRQLEFVTDASIFEIARHCKHILELDLYGCVQITDASMWALWRELPHLRELTVTSSRITEQAFPFQSSTGKILVGGELTAATASVEWAPGTVAPAKQTSTSPPFPEMFVTVPAKHFEHVRYLDLSSQAGLTDEGVQRIVTHMQRIRNLILAKCFNLTDECADSICRLGKYLHYLHLGHVASITDAAVCKLARNCTRLRYIDLACCNQLTDLSVHELSALPRLKRIGLVRVIHITDESIFSLADRKTLERIHLSYCEDISVQAIHHLLSNLLHLTHLSLTGVPAFRRPDLQAYCRTPPKEFNTHQQQAFCVYSGRGISDLRRYLDEVATREQDGFQRQPDELRQQTHRHRHRPRQNGANGAGPVVATAARRPRIRPAAAPVAADPQSLNFHGSHTFNASRQVLSAPANLGSFVSAQSGTVQTQPNVWATVPVPTSQPLPGYPQLGLAQLALPFSVTRQQHAQVASTSTNTRDADDDVSDMSDVASVRPLPARNEMDSDNEGTVRADHVP